MEHDPEHQRQAAQRRASLDYIRDHLSKLRKDHLNRWVAVLNARVVVEGDTLEQVVAELERRRVPLGSVATQFVYPEDTEFIPVSLRGRFDEMGGRCSRRASLFPERRTSLAVDFLVDTGADRTVLMPNDAGPLGLDHDDVEVHVLGSGFGGVAVGTREWISVAPLEPGVGEYRFVVHADVPRGESILPSVLGRDILDRCRLTYDPTNGVLDLEVWRSDDFVPA